MLIIMNFIQYIYEIWKVLNIFILIVYFIPGIIRIILNIKQKVKIKFFNSFLNI